MKQEPHYDRQTCNVFNKFTSLVLLAVFLLLVVVLLGVFLLVVPSTEVVPSEDMESRFLVKTLPGFLGDLPITLETGYIGVGESEEVQLFYYFIESEGNPEKDPLMLMLSGGPGCSGLAKVLAETGPFTFNYASSSSKKPILEINPYSWTKVGSIISLDQPAGTGFSYAETSNAYTTNDTLSAIQVYQFLRKWLVDHPNFLKNPLYVCGDSYAGLVVPMIVQEIYNGNEVGEGPHMNINGYVIGNAVTDTNDEYNSRIPFAHRLALLSDEIYVSAKENCFGEYLNVDPNNSLCINDLQVVDKCLERIKMEHVLEPNCDTSIAVKGCPDNKSKYLSAWANRRDVQKALHIREESKDAKWVPCNESLKFYYDKEPISYTHNVLSNVAYHQHLASKNCRALVYSGDHDMVVPYLSTLNWIKSLNLLVVNAWRPWFVDQQVAGYNRKYSYHDYNLTFATVKGGAHTVPDNKPKESLSMLMKWLVDDAL
ncbi:unnamed protein product [Lactuca virosa]|uniref:Serine carboxypeptidase-like 18 n=1 Tax=Lactuca virosa TaxID=75947 RepID=A0AAU9MFS5_9ASTR|nr:unnamed protein product [Lactuca virosa]